MKTFKIMVDKLNEALFILISLLFGLTGIITIYQVIARFVFNNPPVWGEEAVRYLMIWIVLIGTAIALRKGLLISVEILIHLLPKKIKSVMHLLIIVLNTVFLFILVTYGFKIMDSLQAAKVGALDIPVSWTYAAIPVGASIGILNCIVLFIEWMQGNREGQKDDSINIL